MAKTGRNDPCPCGSGKKYKKCCGASSSAALNKPKADYFNVNRQIAYKGEIGRRRRQFCADYIDKKQKYLAAIEKQQLEEVAAANKTITCHCGCSYCCSTYVQASVQECEAIVYYLYQNDKILGRFLEKYPVWRAAIRRNGDLFRQCSRFWQMDVDDSNRQQMQQQFSEENSRYYRQNIPCPFLHEGACSIYEVRPYMCAALVSVTTPEWCRPGSPDAPEQLRVYPSEIENDLSFYYGELEDRVLSYMPLTIYEILKNGTYYLSSVVPYLKELDGEFCADPEVASVISRSGVFDYRLHR